MNAKSKALKKKSTGKYKIVSCNKCGNSNGSHTDDCPKMKK